MKMVTTTTAALALLLALGAVRPAAADDAPGQATKQGHWLYEVRIVRVDPGEAAASEAGSPFPELKDTTIQLPWSTILARLKGRGTTTVLMDTRVNALDGVKSVVSEETSTPITALNFHDRNNEQFRSQLVKQGCSFEQTTSARAGRLQYLIQVRGAATPPEPTKPPTQYVTSWNGTHAVLEGSTLVLEHRRQVAVAARGPRGPHALFDLTKKRNKLSGQLHGHAARLTDIAERVATVRREMDLTSRRDTRAKLAAELANLQAKQTATEAALAQARLEEREIVAALEAAKRAKPKAAGKRAIEHYAFVTGRYVAK